MFRARIRGAVLTAVAASAIGVGLFAAPTAAIAHDSLTGAEPAAGSTVGQVEQVTLSYSGTLLSIGEDQRSAALQVMRDGRYFETGCPRLVDNTASVDVALGEAGSYEVLWQVVSSDGHTISGEYEFDYTPDDGAAASDGAEAPACGEAAEETGGPSDDAILIGAAVGIGVLALIGVGVAIILGRRRGTPDEDGKE